jgi:ribonuclease D
MESAFEYVDNESSLRALTKALGRAERVALDTEADSLHHYFEKVCLIQLTFNQSNYIVDPLAQLDLSAFLSTLAGKNLLVHGGEYDLRMMLSSLDFKPQKEVFDTLPAAQLVGCDQLGLVALAEKYLGVTLSKHGQRSDWSRRPLTPAQLAYAVDDTRYLAPLAEALAAELARLGRAKWHREMCRHIVEVTQEEKPPADPDRIWRIKGCRDLTNRQLAFVRELWHWRDREARAADLPPFKVIGNQGLLDLTLWATTGRGRDLRKGPKLPRSCIGNRLAALQQALAAARNLPDDRLPTQPKSRGTRPEFGPELERVRSVCNRIAAEHGMESSLIASRKTLETLSLQKPRTLDEIKRIGRLMPWQVELLGPALLEVFSSSD